ncbi:unnamed protein product [Orchesella dallaii]|uniref:MARVEL domain-containing protein n=1 Tax=Orchesella dallaii TaxID=48710 RepID=A0ABP1RWQ4_9HEXA
MVKRESTTEQSRNSFAFAVLSRPGMGKFGILVFGIVILGLGLASHFDSHWRTLNTKTSVCKQFKDAQSSVAVQLPACPPFSMEEYFVSMIIICFILSSGALIISVLIDTSKGVHLYIDAGYHAVATLLLFIAGAVYTASGAQIRNLEQISGIPGGVVTLRSGEKIAAGVLTIIYALMYGAVAFLILKGDKLASHPDSVVSLN